MIISTAPISEYEQKPRCEVCHSGNVRPTGQMFISTVTHDAYTCNVCSATTTGYSKAKLEIINKLATSNVASSGISWTSASTSSSVASNSNMTSISNDYNGTGTSYGYSPTNYGQTQLPLTTKDVLVENAIRDLAYKNDQTNIKLDTINSNLHSLVFEMQKLLKKIDDANLTNPLTNVLNRVKNFELK